MDETNRDRLKSALCVIFFHALLAYAFIAGLRLDIGGTADRSLKLFDVRSVPPPPPQPEMAPPQGLLEAQGAAAPPAPKADPSPVVAPKPAILLEAPPPVAAAPVPRLGDTPSSGAAQQGTGAGAGGAGAGLGSGRAGSGTGGGGGAVPARQIAGRIADSDYPRAARRARAEGTVLVHFTVGADGRVTDCRVVQSSNNADLDTTTCRLIRQRYRFEPARDAFGRAISDEKGWRQNWWLERGSLRTQQPAPPAAPAE